MAKVKSTLNTEEKSKVKEIINSLKQSRLATIPSLVKYNKVEPKNTVSVNSVLKTAGDKAEEDDELKNGEAIISEVKTNTGENEVKNEPQNKDDIKDDAEKLSVAGNVGELVEQLKGVEESYEGVKDSDYYKHLLPEIKESLGLEKMDEVVIDKSDIASRVEEKLNALYNQKREGLKTTTEGKIEDIKVGVENMHQNAEKAREEIGEVYSTAKENVSADALKRGLARSSIAILSIEGIEKQQAKSLSELANSILEEMAISEKQIAGLNQELETSLDNLNLELAMKIKEEIDEEVEKLTKKQQEAIEFNNNVEKLEAEYQIKRNQAVEDNLKLEEELKEKFSGVATTKKREDMLELCVNYFNTLSKGDAINELIASDELKQLLGNKFNDLYYIIMRREDR